MHPVIVFDSRLAPDSLRKKMKERGKVLRVEGSGRERKRGYWATDGPQGPTSCVSFSHKAVMRTHWGDFKRRPWISLPLSRASDLNCLWNRIVNRDCMLSVFEELSLVRFDPVLIAVHLSPFGSFSSFIAFVSCHLQMSWGIQGLSPWLLYHVLYISNASCVS